MERAFRLLSSGRPASIGISFMNSLIPVFRSAPFLDRVFASIFTSGIVFYKKHISPHKGFRCSYAQLFGGKSCSSIALEAFQSYGFAQAYTIMMEQFEKCRAAHFGELPDIADQAFRNLPDFLNRGTVGDCCFPARPPPPPPPP